MESILSELGILLLAVLICIWIIIDVKHKKKELEILKEIKTGITSVETLFNNSDEASLKEATETVSNKATEKIENLDITEISNLKERESFEEFSKQETTEAELEGLEKETSILEDEKDVMLNEEKDINTGLTPELETAGAELEKNIQGGFPSESEFLRDLEEASNKFKTDVEEKMATVNTQNSAYNSVNINNEKKTYSDYIIKKPDYISKTGRQYYKEDIEMQIRD